VAAPLNEESPIDHSTGNRSNGIFVFDIFEERDDRMNNIDDAHEESNDSPSTTELLAGLFEEPKESKIRHVKVKAGPKLAAKKSDAAVRPMKNVQQQTPANHRGRKTPPSGSKIEARATKKKTQVRRPAVPRNITVEDPGIKAHAQQKVHKTVAEKRSVPAIRKSLDKGISDSRVAKRERPFVSKGCVHPPEASSHSQRRSIFGSTTLGIGLPFAMGILLTFLGTRLAPLYLFDGDQAIAVAKNEMVEKPAPINQGVTISTASAATIDTANHDNENKTPEPPSVEPEERTIGGSTPKELDSPVSETPQRIMVTAKQEVSSTSPELFMSTHSGQATKTKTFQRDESKSYPYSIYLGSYKNMDSAQEAISVFQKKGLSPYWVRVDLGEKGVWYRVLAGYFRKKDEVNAFIEKNRITEGRSRYILYANLLGLYSSDEELREKKNSLVELGYCPYVIEGDEGESFLFSGAFYYKADAEREHIELASKGIQSQLVKR
jgi:cell division septation protein DedD